MASINTLSIGDEFYYFNYLEPEIKFHIMSFLDNKTLHNFSETSVANNEMAKCNYLWGKILKNLGLQITEDTRPFSSRFFYENAKVQFFNIREDAAEIKDYYESISRKTLSIDKDINFKNIKDLKEKIDCCDLFHEMQELILEIDFILSFLSNSFLDYSFPITKEGLKDLETMKRAYSIIMDWKAFINEFPKANFTYVNFEYLEANEDFENTIKFFHDWVEKNSEELLNAVNDNNQTALHVAARQANFATHNFDDSKNIRKPNKEFLETIFEIIPEDKKSEYVQKIDKFGMNSLYYAWTKTSQNGEVSNSFVNEEFYKLLSPYC